MCLSLMASGPEHYHDQLTRSRTQQGHGPEQDNDQDQDEKIRAWNRTR